MSNEIMVAPTAEKTLKERTLDIVNQYGLNFEIEKIPLVGFRDIEIDGNVAHTEEVASDYVGLLNSKSGKIINAVKSGYVPVQNYNFIELVLRGLDLFDVETSVSKAGVINGARKVFIQFRIASKSFHGETIQRYLTIFNGNDGSKFSVGIGEQVMSCSNQYYYFKKSAQMKFSHTSSIEAKLEELPFLLENALDSVFETDKMYERFFNTEVTDEVKHGLVKTLTGVSALDEDFEQIGKRKRNNVNKLYTTLDSEMVEKGGNLWGLFNGVTYWNTHQKINPKRENGAVESLMVGTKFRSNQTAFSYLSEAAIG